MKEHSWVCTLVTQIFLCSVLFIAINIGQPQKHVFDRRTQSRPLDVLFMSVVGGYRPPQEHFLLLKQMAEVAKVYKPEFVVNISELGEEEDPLTQNATGQFQTLNIPWYNTKSSRGLGVDNLPKQVKIPYGKSLDLIALNSELFQGSPAGARENQLVWLKKTLEESNSEWRIIVGFHPLLACNGSTEGKETEYLHHMFLKYGVNVYLSGLACAKKGGAELLSNATEVEKGPYLTSVNNISLQQKERGNGFLLHRVTPLELVTYFVNLKGEVVERVELLQRGKEVM